MKNDIFDLLADIPKRMVDETAFSVEEIAKAQNVARYTASLQAKKMVSDGKWEQVWKMGTLRLIPAYRKAKRGNK